MARRANTESRDMEGLAAFSGTPAPPPADVRYNDWSAIDVPSMDAFTPVLPVSVVVSYYESPRELERLVAALERQTYPRDLFEVIVVDDGSATPARAPQGTSLNLRIVRQEDRGFGLARARNNGARAAIHDILVFLDGDIIPDATMLAAHARWHHLIADALTFGFRARLPDADVDPDTIRHHRGSLRPLLGGTTIDWTREGRLRATRDLTSRCDYPFLTVLGFNFAIRKAFYDWVGGSDESFRRYGWEETELAYRCYARGGLLIPEREALSWHRAHTGPDVADKIRSTTWQRAKAAQRIPHEECRRFPPAGQPGIYAVPRHVVTVVMGDASADQTATTVEKLLGDPAGDIVVCVEPGVDGAESVSWLEDRFGADPRVLIEPLRPALDEFPVTPFHLTVPAAAAFRPGLVALMRRRMRSAVMATVRLNRGQTATIALGWALHRASRSGKPVAQFGRATSISGRSWVRASLAREARRTRMRLRQRALLHGSLRVRSAQHALRIARRVLRGRGQNRTLDKLPTRSVGRPTDSDLGVEIAASARVSPRGRIRRFDVLLVDTPSDIQHGDAPPAVIAESPRLAVSAVNPRIDGPMGWLRDVAPLTAALGSTGALPYPLRAHFRSAPSNRESLRHAHHLVDAATLHANPASRAGILLRIAASGIPIHLADDDPELAALLGPELHNLMSDPAVPGANTATREAFSIRMRRIALGEHSLRALTHARQVCKAAAQADAPGAPEVSILLAIRRPNSLAWALRNVARQTHSNLELVLALLGDGFDDDRVRALTKRLTIPIRFMHAAAEPLGTVLNAAAAAASGKFVSWMRDDVLYDAHHIGDLVLAHEYSGAHLVGKGLETVYQTGADRTVRFINGRAETYTDSLVGGTVLIARQDLHRFGGWREGASAADLALIDDIGRDGVKRYRTHGSGFLLVLNSHSDPSATGNIPISARVETSQAGWRPELAGMGDVAEPQPPGAAT